MSLETLILTLAELVGINLTKLRLSAYQDALKELSPAEIKTAYEFLIRDPDLKFMPPPGKIIQAALQKLDPRKAALISLTRLKTAVVKFGWPRPEEAMDFLSPEEWDFVGRSGGWQKFCELPENNINDSTVYAQMRDSLEANYVARSHANYDQLMGKTNPKLDNVLKTLGVKMDLNNLTKEQKND